MAAPKNGDGRGYPDGLAGDDIPLLSRIIAVADTYDAMTSNRPYRSALPHEAAELQPRQRKRARPALRRGVPYRGKGV